MKLLTIGCRAGSHRGQKFVARRTPVGILSSHHGTKWGRVVAAAALVSPKAYGGGGIVNRVGPAVTRPRPIGRVWEITTG